MHCVFLASSNALIFAPKGLSVYSKGNLLLYRQRVAKKWQDSFEFLPVLLLQLKHKFPTRFMLKATIAGEWRTFNLNKQ